MALTASSTIPLLFKLWLQPLQGPAWSFVNRFQYYEGFQNPGIATIGLEPIVYKEIWRSMSKPSTLRNVTYCRHTHFVTWVCLSRVVAWNNLEKHLKTSTRWEGVVFVWCLCGLWVVFEWSSRNNLEKQLGERVLLFNSSSTFSHKQFGEAFKDLN